MDIITKLSSSAEPSLSDDENEVDPADFLFKETKYHDWLVTVGDPASDKTTVEKFGVVSCYLLSQSPFFRKMVAGNQLGDTRNINITDVSPAVFKLVLKYVYGGKLVDIDRSTAAQLALTANSYKMAGLVTEASKRLIPTCVDEVFPALWCVSYVHCPDLEPHVTKIIEEETNSVVERKEFLDLDSKCVEFIAKQEKLEISELDLWKALVKWAQCKALTSPEKSTREHLQNILQFVRLTTLSNEEIIKEVITTKILTSTEGLELLTAITINQPWEVPGFCKTQQARAESNDMKSSKICDQSNFSITHKLLLSDETTEESLVEQPDYRSISVFTVKTVKDIEINALSFQTISVEKIDKPPVYTLSCSITVRKIEEGFVKETQIIQVGGCIVCKRQIQFPLKLRNGQSLRLEANGWYTFTLKFSSPHPVHKLVCNSADVTDKIINSADNMTVQFNTPFHITKITYKI